MTDFGETTRVKIVGGVVYARQSGASNEVLRKSFADIARRTGHLEKAFAAFVPVWQRQERAVFRAQGIPRWGKLQPGYESWKRAHYPGKTILRRDDLLYRSLTTRARYSIIKIHPRTLELGTSLWYSAELEQAFRRRPARPHVVILRETFEVLNDLCLAEILAAPALKGGRRR